MKDNTQTQRFSRKHLTILKNKLVQVSGSWTVDEYRSFITFYSRILPELMSTERCTIFIMEQNEKKICSIFGTGLEEQQIEPPLEGSVVGQVIGTGESRIENDLVDLQGYHAELAEKTGFTSRNLICSPIRAISGNRIIGAIQLINKLNQENFTREDLGRLDEIAHFLSLSIESVVLNQEILTLASSIEKEVDRFEQDMVSGVALIAESPAMREVINLVNVISSTPVNVLIQGENGTGKELIAQMIHQRGDRRDKPFVPVNCACIPESLVESEFFGHEKGAFTGADKSRRGLFETAEGGTLFLDEIGEMPLMIQPKILRAIQEGEGSRLGNSRTINYDLRLISASNRDLGLEIKEGRFREDLFFRLFSVEIVIPPLRDRKEDILPLAQYFLQQTNERFSKRVAGFSSEVMGLFEKYPWPGNVRQLLKEVERLVALTEDGQIIVPDRCSRELHSFFTNSNKRRRETDYHDLSIPAQTKRLEVDLIRKALHQTNGNKSKASELLKITRQGLLKKIKRFEIRF
jgi:transcriptional regulator with GAF, ATPase, and Fis domain